MISDVLFEAVEGLDYYLNEPVYDDIYSGELRAWILSLRSAMEDMRRELDNIPKNRPLETKTIETNATELIQQECLVVLRCAMDDLPIKMFSSAAAAIEWASTTNPDIWGDDFLTLAWPDSTALGVSVIAFDADGRPKEIYHRDFDDEIYEVAECNKS